MKIIRLAAGNIAWRCCIARRTQRGELEMKPLYPTAEEQWTPLRVGMTIPGEVHVGTKAKFCLAYYGSGYTDVPGEFEVLLTLRVPPGTIPDPKDDAYMGGERIVSNPVVLKIETYQEACNNPAYDF